MICLKKLFLFLCVSSIFIFKATPQTTGEERTIQNPGYIELAPCPCDVSANLCDFGCCCDKDCSTKDQARFESCLPGFLGGQGGDKQDYKCGTKAFNPPDWHQMTCVYWEKNEAYLGMFFMNKGKIANEDDFKSISVEYMEDKYTLRVAGNRYEDKDFAEENYEKGSVVMTRRPDLSAHVSYRRDQLSLPQPINSGWCNTLAPVRFLEPVQSSCPVSLTTTSCSSLTSFSADIFVVSSAITSSPKPFEVRSTLEGDAIVDTEVRYYCTTDYSSYLPSTASPLGSLSSTTASSFPNTLLNTNCSDACSEDACWQYNTGRTFTDDPDLQPLPSRCGFDNGQTLPPTPSMNGGTCQNAVLEVRYSFEWSGSTITKLVADVILADIAGVTTTPIDLAQKFSVRWTYGGNITSSVVEDNFYNLTEPYERSGIAGYEIERPLQSGCRQSDATSDQFLAVETQAEKQMAVFRPGVDGLCANAQRELLSFGEDVMSSCALRLSLDDLTSCDDLRQLITNHLNVLMPSDVVGRYGYNDPKNQDMWISVIRENLTEVYESMAKVSSPFTPSLGNETAFRLAESIEGICLLPSAVNLVVLYAQTGAINFHPRVEVIGTYVNYTVSNWTMLCMGANSGRCVASSGQTQNFFLTSSVQFVRVPATPPTPRTRFYTKHDPETCETDTCYRFFTDWDTDLCYYDTCWQEIVYPLTSVYRGDSHEYALAVFLLVVLGIVGYSAVTKPGWDGS